MNMSAKRNFYLGLFVVSGFALMVIAVFAFGVASFLRPKAQLATCFSESVQGLDVGSPVKYKGVPIGAVKKITLDMDAQLIMVLMEVELDTLAFGGEYNKDGEELFAAFIRNGIAGGLRCHLEYSGITGMKYIEMDYMASGKHSGELEPPPQLAGAFPGVGYLPSTPSAISDMLTTLNASLENIASIDFNSIGESLDANLVQLEKLLADPGVPVIVDNLRQTSANMAEFTNTLNVALTQETINGMTGGMTALLNDLSRASEKITAEVESARVGEVSEALQEAMEKLQETQRPLLHSLEQFDAAVDGFDLLVRQLSNDPGSLLRGSSVPPVDLKKLEK